MAEYLCHGCNAKKVQSDVYECTTCKKILCSRCKAGAYYCKDSTKGKAGCSGQMKKL